MSENLAYQEEIWEELIDGKIFMMSPRPTIYHNFISGNIYSIFHAYLRKKSCTPFADGTDLYLTEKERFIPDGMIVCDPDKIKQNGVHGAPDLVIEVLSPSTAKNDKGHKKDVYERCGVKEYWIVDPANRTVEQYLLQNNRFILREVYVLYREYELERMKEEERAAIITEFKCSLFDDLVIQVADIFERVP